MKDDHCGDNYMQLLQLRKECHISRIPYKPEFFSGFLFATAKVAYITPMIILHLILHSAVHIYGFRIFVTS